MARTTRKALDMALVSLEKTRPAVAKVWDTTKSCIMDTRAKPLVCNPCVESIEETVLKLTGTLSTSLKTLRDKQLPAEVEYLEEELNKIKKKLYEQGRKQENIN